MRGWKSHIVFALVLAIGLAGWPLAARACGFNGVGDYICDKGGTPGGSILTQGRQNQAATLKSQTGSASQYAPKAYYLSGSQLSSGVSPTELVALSRAVQSSLAEARAAADKAFRSGGECAFISTGDAPSVSGSSFYASPNGKGDCSAGSPCSLQVALDKAGPGDEVVLKDGRYYSALSTRRDGVTIRAENPHQAIVSPPKGHDLGVCCSVEDARKTPKRPGDNFIRYSMGDKGYVNINHDNITVSGIIFDGKAQNGDMSFGIGGIRGAKNVIFENNVMRNSKGAPLGMNFSENVILRHNVIGGGETWSEGLYFAGNPDRGPPNRNIQFYGNIVQGTPSNLLDIKYNGNDGYDIHHNIFQGQVNRQNLRARDGCLLISGARINFHDNILRDSHCGTAPLNNIPAFSGSRISNNVFSNIQNRNGAAVRYKNSHNFGPTEIVDNTFCGVAGDKICLGNGHDTCGTKAPAGMKVSIGISAPAACNSEEQRILGEMQNLPSGGGWWDCSGGSGEASVQGTNGGGVTQASTNAVAGGTTSAPAAAAPSQSQSQGSDVSSSETPPASCSAPSCSGGGVTQASAGGTNSGAPAAAAPPPSNPTIVLQNYEGLTQVPRNNWGAEYPSYYDDFQVRKEGGVFNSSILHSTTQCKEGNDCLQMHLTSGTLYAQFNPYSNCCVEWARDYAIDPSPWQFNTYNRFSYWIYVPASMVNIPSDGTQVWNMGTYVRRVTNFDPSSQEAGGGHYYHYFNLFEGWNLVTFNMHPTHTRHGASVPDVTNNYNGEIEIGNLPHPTGESQYNYWDALTRFYVGKIYGADDAGATVLLDNLKFYQEIATEPDDQVYNIVGNYNLNLNRVSLSWNRHKNQSGNHEVRYAFQDIHQIGWNAATPAPNGTVAPSGSGSSNGMIYQTTSINTSGHPTLYLAIKPQNSSLFSQIAIPTG